MENLKNELVIDGQTYILKSSVKDSGSLAVKKGKLPYKIVRTRSAGVFAGYLQSLKGSEAVILDARRLWYWDGAASLSQLAVDGVSKPQNCKFPIAVSRIQVTGVIEVLDVTKKAQDSIAGVKVWQQ